MNITTTTAGSTVSCAWCGKHLGNATSITYLNGNQPVCDLCLMRAKQPIPFIGKLLTNAEDVPPEYSKVVDEYFWELI